MPFSLASDVDYGLRLPVVKSLLYVAVLIAWVASPAAAVHSGTSR